MTEQQLILKEYGEIIRSVLTVAEMTGSKRELQMAISSLFWEGRKDPSRLACASLVLSHCAYECEMRGDDSFAKVYQDGRKSCDDFAEGAFEEKDLEHYRDLTASS